MPDASDRDVVQGQYADAQRLNARAALHVRFSTSRIGWFTWVWDRLTLGPGMRVLEVGCGDGSLWQGRTEAIPEGVSLALTDLSPGMIREARDRPAAHAALYAVADAQHLPFSDAQFDLVIANHVLYHVPDRRRALAEIRRVLAPGGRLCATTIGERHMGELQGWLREAAPEAAIWGVQASGFTLQSASGDLEELFNDVSCDHLPDSLEVTEIEPLMAYALSMDVDESLAAHSAALRAIFEREMEAHGAIHITKESGMLTAHA
jgi:SAM-dependent methyltransferase